MKSYLQFHRGHRAFAHDLSMAAVSFLLSLWLRLGDGIFLDAGETHLFFEAVLFVVVAAFVFWSQRLYRGMWRYSSIQDLLALVRASTLINLIFLPVLFVFDRLAYFPRSFVAINWFVLIFLLGGGRFLYRIINDYRTQLHNAGQDTRMVPVLLVGVNNQAELFLRATKGPNTQYRAVGILSENATKVGRGIHAIPVLGTVADLENVVADLVQKELAPERLIVTHENMSGALLRDLMDRADALGMTLARLPKMTDFVDAQDEEVSLRQIAIEDLLGRQQTTLDRDAMASLIRGRKVLVTGAGGSIGGELVRQIADNSPAEIVLLESSEFALYTIRREVTEKYPRLSTSAIIADVRDRRRIGSVMADCRPEIVLHAAALKHVPIVEENPVEGLFTNAIGTRIVADACRDNQVKLMVLISTDKAVNPANIMGGTKRIAEIYCQALDQDAYSDSTWVRTRFVTVRFGNVLGSTGSVVPLFQHQLQMGGPITVTHPDMTRYFMTIREAVELVLQASAFVHSHPAEYQGRIFVLDMGEPVKIIHLARQMIRLAGLRPDKDIAIEFTGLRPGEKLFEEIFHGSEEVVSTGMDGILLAGVRAGDLAEVTSALDRLEDACRNNLREEAFAVFHGLVPEYLGQ